MTTQAAALNDDTNGKLTSSEYGDRGDGTSKWYQWKRVGNGGDVAQGATTDAAVTSSASNGSVIALLKGVLAHLAAAATRLPVSATFVRAVSGNVANASAAATMPAVSGKTNYLTGFSVTASGATAAAVVQVTITGLSGGSAVYIFVAPAGVTAQAVPLVVDFAHPIPASATNTQIVVTCPALGSGNTNAAVEVRGFVV